jgi:bifunctional DNA-binding transcriptional regulator/antitoxin component of YhaV-PrlF toxin-antitoxin module
MLAKVTTKNQITLPKAVITRFGGVEYFDVSTDGSAILLKPLRPSRLDDVRAKLEQLGITEQDVTDAVAWARKNR